MFRAAGFGIERTDDHTVGFTGLLFHISGGALDAVPARVEGSLVVLDGTGRSSARTGIPFFDHMLEQLEERDGVKELI